MGFDINKLEGVLEDSSQVLNWIYLGIVMTFHITLLREYCLCTCCHICHACNLLFNIHMKCIAGLGWNMLKHPDKNAKNSFADTFVSDMALFMQELQG